MKLWANLRSLKLASVLTPSDNRRVSGFVPSALRPNPAFAKFITVILFSGVMSEGTLDTPRNIVIYKGKRLFTFRH